MANGYITKLGRLESFCLYRLIMPKKGVQYSVFFAVVTILYIEGILYIIIYIIIYNIK